MVIKPAAGPETPLLDPLKAPTIIPPIIPAKIPENGLGSPGIPETEVEAKPRPMHNGKATKKTTILAGKSFCHALKK